MITNLFSALCARWTACLAALAALAGPILGMPQEPMELRVGHWVVVRGELKPNGHFLASQINLTQPESDETIIGTVKRVDDRGQWIEVLDQRITLSARTKYRKLKPKELLGNRIKVEGHYRNLNKFSGRELSARGPGRERISARIDAIHSGAGGLELELMRYRVMLTPSTLYVREKDLDQYALAEPRNAREQQDGELNEGLIVRVDEDYLPGSFKISENFQVGIRAEFSDTTERDYDLDGGQAADRIDDELSLRAVGIWSPHDRFFMRFGGRLSWLDRDDEEDGDSSDSRSRLTEIYGYWSRLFDVPLDLQVGRQDYYDEREWLWDENLDALRLFYHPENWIVELAAATTLSSGSPREEDTERFILSATRHWSDRTLVAYIIDQRGRLNGRDYPFFAGLRAYGEWFPDQKNWAELSMVRGYEGQADIRGWGLDLGSTWSASRAKPWYLSAGYAFGSGDDDGSDGVDHAFRQTGIQDNNDKFGGVTSFKYYGELLEPELSNLHVLTLGVGRRFGRRMSLDLIYHN